MFAPSLIHLSDDWVGIRIPTVFCSSADTVVAEAAPIEHTIAAASAVLTNFLFILFPPCSYLYKLSVTCTVFVLHPVQTHHCFCVFCTFMYHLLRLTVSTLYTHPRIFVKYFLYTSVFYVYFAHKFVCTFSTFASHSCIHLFHSTGKPKIRQANIITKSSLECILTNLPKTEYTVTELQSIAIISLIRT